MRSSLEQGEADMHTFFYSAMSLENVNRAFLPLSRLPVKASVETSHHALLIPLSSVATLPRHACMHANKSPPRDPTDTQCL